MKVNSIATNRHLKILDILSRQGKTRIDELSEKLDVSPVTIRRDLDYLNKKKLLIRTHGGASKIETGLSDISEQSFSEKGIINTFEKKKIAEKAASLIGDDEIIYINSGSTVLYFIQALINKRVKIITNNAGALRCKKEKGIELVLLGGEYREQSQSFIGTITIENIQNINSTYTILGTNGFSLDRGLTSSVLQECSVNQAMISNTNKKVIVLADHSKIGHTSNFVTASLDIVDVLITDDKAPEDVIEKIREKGIEVIIA